MYVRGAALLFLPFHNENVSLHEMFYFARVLRTGPGNDSMFMLIDFQWNRFMIVSCCLFTKSQCVAVIDFK